MEKIEKLIKENLESYPDFEYYLNLIDEAKRFKEIYPDMCVETCNTLIQGIGGKIINEYDEEQYKQLYFEENGDDKYPTTIAIIKNCVNNFLIHQNEKKIVKQSATTVGQHADMIKEANKNRNDSITNVLVNKVKPINEIRNKRGDICHGRIAPKKYITDQDVCEYIFDITSSMLNLIFRRFIEFQSKKDKNIMDYDKETKFNNYLDKENPLKSTNYKFSEILYKAKPEEYRILCKNYKNND